MTDFLETPRFEPAISYGSTGGPGFNTTVFEGHGGVEQRGRNWATTKGKWNVAHGIRDTADFEAIRKMFMAVYGKAIGFRFKDWGDYQMALEIATPLGDGVTTIFKMQRTYTSGALSYTRRIFKPVSGTIHVFDDGVERTVGTADANRVTIDYATGKMTFGASIIPVAAHVITVTGEYDLPVRFDTDFLDVSQENFDMETWNNIPLVELLLPDV
jgi:uncharacterized protein (TIGR02217 family)